MPSARCVCENSDHFDSSKGEHPVAHPYGHVCEDVEPVKTDYGTFEVCKECREGHWKEVIR